jgi:hypothetical protein
MPCNCGSKDDWKAILDEMSPQSPRLRVTGTAECSTTGYKNVRLEPVRPPGINPLILLLELKWESPTGAAGDIITPHPVKYEEQNSPRYQTVEIVNCDQKKIKVEVAT